MNKATAGRSLRLRLLMGFVWPTVLIWLVLAGWAVVDALHLGHDVLEKELTSYARQVLIVADTFRDEPVRLAQAIRAIEQVDNEAERLGDLNGVDQSRIQIWLGDRLLVPVPELPSERPAALPVYRDLFPDAKREVRWGSVVQQRAATADGLPAVTVRVAIRNTGRAALLWPSLGLVVVPLLVCLPLLLVPAWVMTRHGLRPLDALVQEISARVASGALTRLPPVGYRELQPVIEAMNRLLERLEGQLQRERGFVADVAHEMKTPLAILRSNLDTLRSSRDPLRREAAQRDLHTGLDRASHLIGQLLRMARLEADAPVERARAVDLAEFIRERVAVLVPLADARGQALEVEMPEVLPGRFDVEAVGAIVDNLIDNAIKYADPDSVVHVELVSCQALMDGWRGPSPHPNPPPLGEGARLDRTAPEPDPLPPAGGGREGGLRGQPTLDTTRALQRSAPEGEGVIVLTVTDQGPGIDPAQQGAALTRFGRAGRQDTAGAGLGLSIVQRAARRLGGELVLGVAPAGRGLRAEVRFPRTGPSPDQNAAA